MDYDSRVFIFFSDGISLFIYNWHLKKIDRLVLENAIWKALYPYFLQVFSLLSFSLFL